MVEKTNIKIENKLTKKIYYKLYLDEDFWYKEEFDTRGNVIYFKDSSGYWAKAEYNYSSKEIYFENNRGITHDDR
jgi:hypothetical protein